MKLTGKELLRRYVRSALLIAAGSVVACAEINEEEESYNTGVFIDAPVSNINYKTDTNRGVTNDKGEFLYKPGDSVTFYIDELLLPPVEASSVVTPLHIAKATSNDSKEQAIIAVNIARLLQSLDTDGNPANGIALQNDLKVSNGLDLTLNASDFESAMKTLMPDIALVKRDAAIAHLVSHLTSLGINIDILEKLKDLINDSGDNSDDSDDDSDDNSNDTDEDSDGSFVVDGSELPITIDNTLQYSFDADITGSLQKLVTLELAIDVNYASLSLTSGDTWLIDSMDVPSAGTHTLQALVKFPAAGEQQLVFSGRSEAITINKVTFTDVTEELVMFNDISSDIGLITEDTYKYGGPAIGDVNNDGHYDFVTANHNYIPPQLVTNNGDNTVTIQRLFAGAQDFHGNALGDYDADGDLDIMVALGGANGTSPTSYALLKNNDGVFENVSVETGINTPARGRSPRWVDFDLDGDLDIILANAKTPNSDGPIQLFYRNMGDGTFTPVRVPGVESQNAERLLITDFNGDQIDDLVLYSPLTIWQGNGNFTFTNVTDTVLPANVRKAWGINAITDVDVNNDGRLDLYLASGKTHYQLSRKSIDFNPANGELNIHDDGEKGTTLIDFKADGAITLSDLKLTYRQWNGDYPIFLGTDKARHVVKAAGFQPNQLPAEMVDAEDTLTVAAAEASGWPEERSVNGLYIGHTGDGNWKAEWVRDQNIYWNVSFTLSGLTDVSYDWTPNNRNGQDVLLVNQGEQFVDASADWNIPKGGDHWGVTHGDFNNDGWNDLFVYRYGFLKQRITDLLLLNTGDGQFITTHNHGAFDPNDTGHGDMGQAFDFDKDGYVDMLSGSEEVGHWYLWNNQTENDNNYLLVDVDYSPLENIDPMSAEIVVSLHTGEQYKKRVSSAGEVFSAGVIDTVHFGLGKATNIASVTVTWRNGESVTLDNVTANQIIYSRDAEAPLPSSLSVDDTSIKLRPTESVVIEPVFTPLNAKPELNWASTDVNIATVTNNGEVTGISDGSVTIMAESHHDNSVFVEITVEVGDFAEVLTTDVQISGFEQPFYLEQQTKLDAVVTPDNADNKTVIWSSSDESIASVNESGLVSNLSLGVTTIKAVTADSEDTVFDSVDITVEEYFEQSVAFDDNSKYTVDIPTDVMFEVTANYHAGSGQTIADSGVTFYFRELTSAWVPVNDLINEELGYAGTTSGSATTTFDLTGLKTTSELDEGNFYFLFVKFTNDKGETVNAGLSPLNVVAPTDDSNTGGDDTSDGGSGSDGEQPDICDATVNLLACGNIDGETSDVSEWYSYVDGAFATDRSSDISMSTEQSNGGTGSIKLEFAPAGEVRHLILKDVKFDVTESGDYKLGVDVLGNNLSTGTDYVIELSIRPFETPENSEVYKLWQKKTAGQWHSLSMTKTLPIGDYIVGFKVFSPGFANTLTLDYYFDNLTINKL
ncbi:MAG: VCBS repeat-containing protein [Gammaproteobacteria bacterium]|nr:VCBS repeat-containing protein [Gammaproteobacteria bacterium]